MNTYELNAQKRKDYTDKYNNDKALADSVYNQNVETSKADTQKGVTGIYTLSRRNALGNNEYLASLGLSGNPYSGYKSGYSETSQFRNDMAMRSDITSAQENGRKYLNNLQMNKQTNDTALKSDYDKSMRDLDASDAAYTYQLEQDAKAKQDAQYERSKEAWLAGDWSPQTQKDMKAGFNITQPYAVMTANQNLYASNYKDASISGLSDKEAAWAAYNGAEYGEDIQKISQKLGSEVYMGKLTNEEAGHIYDYYNRSINGSGTQFGKPIVDPYSGYTPELYTFGNVSGTWKKLDNGQFVPTNINGATDYDRMKKPDMSDAVLGENKLAGKQLKDKVVPPFGTKVGIDANMDTVRGNLNQQKTDDRKLAYLLDMLWIADQKEKHSGLTDPKRGLFVSKNFTKADIYALLDETFGQDATPMLLDFAKYSWGFSL